MMNLVRSMAIVSLLLTLCCVTAIAVPAASGATVPSGWLNGAASFDRAMQLQKDLKVPLVVYFYVDWCPYCHALEQEYFPSAPVREYLSSVIKIKINPELSRADHELGRAFGIGGYPSFFVIGPGSFPVHVSPFRRDGRNLTPAEFAQRCRDVTTPRSAQNFAQPPASATAQPQAVAQPQASAVAPAAVAAPQVSAIAPPKFVSNAPLPTVDEVFKRFSRVTGEALAAGRVTSRVIKGRVSVPGVSFGGRFDFYSTASGKSLTVTMVDSVGTLRQGFDGTSAWTATDSKSPGVEVPQFPLLTEADLFREIRLNNLYSRTKLVGRVREGDREIYLVEATPRNGPAERLYFDVENGLLLHRDLTRSTKRGPMESEIYFSNWRNVDGFLLPCSLTHLIGNLTLVISVDEIKHNVPIDETLFQRPIH
jgi:hypothetical protein